MVWAVSTLHSPTAGRESADTDLDAREVDIDALLSRDQPIFAISELAVFVRCRIRSLFCVPSICAISTLQASSQNPPIPGLSRWHKAELAAKEFSSTKSLFRFFSGCCFAIARASRFRHRAERRSQSKAELAAPNGAPQQQVASRYFGSPPSVPYLVVRSVSYSAAARIC